MSASVSSGGVPESSVDRWLYALKPASWPKLVVPALFSVFSDFGWVSVQKERAMMGDDLSEPA